MIQKHDYLARRLSAIPDIVTDVDGVLDDRRQMMQLRKCGGWRKKKDKDCEKKDKL